jgi:hypothetical protein
MLYMRLCVLFYIYIQVCCGKESGVTVSIVAQRLVNLSVRLPYSAVRDTDEAVWVQVRVWLGVWVWVWVGGASLSGMPTRQYGCRCV